MTLFLKNVLRFICATTLAALSLLVLWGVLTRYIQGEQSIYTDELSQVLLIVLSFFGGALAFSEKSHVGLDILANYFSLDAKKTLNIIINILILIFIFLIMCVGGYFLVIATIKSQYYLTTIPLPMWIIYMSVPISGLFVIYFTFVNIIDLIKGEKKQ